MDTNEVLFQGLTQTIILPDLEPIQIRETNGEDEGIISSLQDATTGENLNKFLASVVKIPTEEDLKRATVQDILNWPLNNKYYTIFKVRRLSLGDILKFNHTCTNPACGCITEYEDNISEYDNDFKNPTPGTNKIQPYPNGKYREITILLSSGKRVKWYVRDGNSEKVALETPLDSLNKNSSLIERNLQIANGDKYEKVTNFKIFSSKDMVEIRASVEKYDKAWDCTLTLKCPKCQNTDKPSLFSIPDFFFPTAI